MVKALAINGSHRKGKSTAAHLKQVTDELERLGVEVETIDLIDYNIKWCSSCNHCMKETKCKIDDDDMAMLGEKLLAADAVIMASPTYWANVSAVMKNFMDRSRYLHLAANLLDGKIGAAITQSGCRNGGQELCINSMERFMKDQGLIVADVRDPESPVTFGGNVGSLQAGYGEKGVQWLRNVSEDTMAMEAAKALANAIVKRLRQTGKMA